MGKTIQTIILWSIGGLVLYYIYTKLADKINGTNTNFGASIGSGIASGIGGLVGGNGLMKPVADAASYYGAQSVDTGDPVQLSDWPGQHLGETVPPDDAAAITDNLVYANVVGANLTGLY
jgi:hypothetical protein